MRFIDNSARIPVETIRCDRCGEERQKDEAEFAEFLSIKHLCGQTASGHAGDKIELDLCFVCFKYSLGTVWKVVELP
jgi:hypothetical protein